MSADALLAQVRLPAARTSPGDARRFITRTLQEWHIGKEPADTACLLATELVTNAVLYATAPIELVMETWDNRLRVQVLDHTQRLPAARAPRDPLSLSGRGLGMVKDLAATWGVTPRADGKSVWFELSTASAAARAR